MKPILTILVAVILISCTKSQPITEATDEWVKEFTQAHPGSHPSSLIPHGGDATTQEYEFSYYPPNNTKTQTIALTFKITNGTWHVERELQKEK